MGTVRRKYTKEVLEPLVLASTSVAAVMRLLGLKPSGGSHAHIKHLIVSYGFDSTHFHGAGWSLRRVAGGPEPLRAAEILIRCRRPGHKERGSILRRALREIGVPDKCALCSLPPVWSGKPLRLEIDHIDGDPLNNERGNLRLLCPNCHSQTETFGSRNAKRPSKKVLTRRYRVGEGVCGRSTKPERTPKPRPTKASWPPTEVLAAMVWANSALTVAKRLGVSSVAVKKRCARLGLPTPSRGYWAKAKAQSRCPGGESNPHATRASVSETEMSA